MLRSGVNRRQVPQLKKMLKEGVSITDISTNLKVMPSVVFTFAKSWNIVLKETPQSVELMKYEAVIKEEVKRRVAEQMEAKAAKPRVPDSKTTMPKSEDKF